MAEVDELREENRKQMFEAREILQGLQKQIDEAICIIGTFLNNNPTTKRLGPSPSFFTPPVGYEEPAQSS
jgi:hypothetical protein